MRQFIALLIVLLMVFGPFAQGVDVGQEIGTESVMMDDVEPPVSIARPDAHELLSNIDGFFTENRGQKSKGAGLFYCEGSPLSVAFGEGWVAYDYRPEDSDEGVLFRVNFNDANPVQPAGKSPTHHGTSYFFDNDVDKWISGARSFHVIEYTDLYDGIDLRFSLEDCTLKYEFTVLPGASPSSIRLEYDGVVALSIEERTGDLVIHTEKGKIIDNAPRSFQGLSDIKALVPSEYQLVGERTVGYSIGDYDKGTAFVIDPGIVFSTYLGGRGAEKYPCHTVDGQGDIYITALSTSSDFPVSTGAYDRTLNGSQSFVVLKINKTGDSILYATYVGEAEDEYGHITVDMAGNAIVTGVTSSTAFPTTPGVIQTSLKGGVDGVLFKVNATGESLMFSTYIGGSDSEGIGPVVPDKTGDFYISGSTASSDFPVPTSGYDSTFNGFRDGYILRCNKNATKILNGTYIGGTAHDSGPGLYLDADGNVLASGSTVSTDFPTTQGAFDTTHNGMDDGYLIRLDSTLSRLGLGTFIGGTDRDGVGISFVDANGSVFLSGGTRSNDFPTTQGVYDTNINGGNDGCVVLMNASFDKILSSTYIGGSSDDFIHGMQVIGNGTIILAGVTGSTDFPTTSTAIDSTHNGVRDLFVLTLDSDLKEVMFSTFFGGAGWDSVRSLSVDYPKVLMVGSTPSTDYPTSQTALQKTLKGSSDAFITSLYLEFVNVSKPSEPLNLHAQPGDGIVSLSWDQPIENGGLDLGGFHVYHGMDPGALVRISTENAGIMTYQDDNPPGFGFPLYYSVSAFNAFAEGNRSLVINVTCFSSPGPPVDVVASPGVGSVTLSWTYPSMTGGKSILGYRIFKGTSRNTLQPVQQLGNVTEHTDEVVENGIEYFYAVMAFNEIGNGTLSTIISATPVGLPSEPRYVQITPGDTQIELEWRAPVSNGGSSILGYHILRGITEAALEEHGTVDHYITVYTDTGLTNGETYHYAIQAFNLIGDGPKSAIVNATPLGLPGTPEDFEIETGDGHVNLSWEAPETTGGTDILRYQVFRGSSEDSLSSLDYTIDGANTIYTDSGLLNGQTFYYAVCAVNNVGDGPWTEVMQAAPLALPDAPGDFVAIDGNGMVTISWTLTQNNGGAELTQYNIYRGTAKDDLELLVIKSKSVFIYDDRDVVVGTTYYYAVLAVTIAGEGSSSVIASATPYGPPGVPISLEVAPGNMEVHLTWSHPDDDGASPIEGYVILRGTSSDSLRELAQLGDVTSYLDTSVTNGQTYYYTVAAINEAGAGDHTDPVSATPFKPATAPDKVTILTVEAKDSIVVVQWTEPQEDGGSPITGYVVLRGEAPGDLEVIATLGPVFTWTDEDVERGTTYYYSVAAINDVGEGEPFFAREVKVPKKKDEGPGFEVFVVIAAMILVIPMMRRRG